MRKNIVLGVMLVVIAFLSYKLLKPKPVINPLPDYQSLAKSPYLSEERRKLGAQYEKQVADLFAAGAAHEEALRDELTNANADHKKALEQEIAQLRARLEAFAQQLTAWRQQVDSRPAGDTSSPSTEAKMPPPPVPPPPPAENTGTPQTAGIDNADEKRKQDEEKRKKEELSKGLAVMGAALCFAQPEICPFVPIILSILGGFTDGEREVVEVLDKAQRGIPVDPATVKKAAEFVRDHPDLKTQLSNMTQQLEQSAQTEMAEAIKQILDNSIPENPLITAIKSGEACRVVQSYLARCGDQPCFENASMKDNAQQQIQSLAPSLYDTYWTNCLSSIEARP